MINHTSSIPALNRLTAVRRVVFGVACAVVVQAAGSPPANAQSQGYGGYLRQSAAMNNMGDNASRAAIASISRGIAREQKSMDGNLANYVRQNFQRLQRQYYSSGANRSMNFKQFANNELLSHATITPDTSAFAAGQRAHQAQVDRFNGMQAANKTRSDAGEMLIHNNQRNSDAQLATVDRADQGSIRGNSSYINQTTGNSQWMPTYSPGARQGTDGTNYFQDSNGRYYQQQGSSWTSMQPTGH